MCTRYLITNRVSELKVHIELTRFVQPEKIEIDANERAVNEKSQYCFFVCTTFDSFLTICYSHDIIFFLQYIHLILIYCLSTCFCNQHPVDLLLHCFLCIFIEMITDNIDCLPDFLCKCVTLCFCIHHFFHNHFSFLLEPQQRVIPMVSVRTLFFKSGPKWALPVSQATYI